MRAVASPQTRSPARRMLGPAAAACRRFAWGQTLSQALALRRPWRYLGAAVLRRPGARHYVVRASGVEVLLRHGSRDIDTFDEMFCSAAYEPPDVVLLALQDLDRPPRIVDLGANVGLFSAFALGRWPGAQITALEPDPENVVLLRSCADLNHVRGEIAVVEAAAAASSGTMRFVAGLAAGSHRAGPAEGATSVEVRAVDVFEHIGGADLVKIDIEGGEWELLGDGRLARGGARALVLEHHGRHCPTDDPRAMATAQLIEAGYEVHAPEAAVNGVGMLWAWRYRARPS